MSRRGPTVAVSGVGAMQPGLPLIRSIRSGPGFEGRFVGLSYDALEPAHYLPDLVDATYLMPYPGLGARYAGERLLEIHRAEGLDAVVPTLDSELGNLIELAPELGAAGIRVLLPTREQLRSCSKAGLPDLATRAGFRVPRTAVCGSLDDARRLAREVGYPLAVKGPLHGAEAVAGEGLLDGALQRVAAAWGLPLVLQEWVAGVEYDVAVLGARDGRVLGAVPMKKLQIDAQGKAWGGITVASDDLDRLVATVMAELRWPGICELELVRREGDGALHVIEINPRAPSWIPLAVVAGQNLPQGLLRLILGEDVEPFPAYAVGAMTVRTVLDLVSPLGVYESLVVGGCSRGPAT